MDLAHVALVKACPLYAQCTNIVIGKGNEHADILFVGEAPGRNEDVQGLPFVGAAGKNLDKLLAQVGLSLNEVYIANILKCRPPENRDPTPEEISAHTPWLLHQIREIKPKVICSLGNYATKFFLSGCVIESMQKQPGITQVHGKVYQITVEGIPITLVPLFHPAAIIYNRKLLEHWEVDMQVVKNVVAGLTGETSHLQKEQLQKKLF